MQPNDIWLTVKSRLPEYRPPPPKLVVERLEPTIPMPQYANHTDSGFDLYAPYDVLVGQAVELVYLGIRAEIPEGYEVQIRPRSSMAKRGFIIPNSPGTIDTGYRGEWAVPIANINSSQKICKGDRIAQAVLAPVTRANIVEGVVSVDTERGEGGFGSTGR